MQVHKAIIYCLLVASAGAQEVEPPTAAWTHRLIGSINTNQIALKDWSQGGEDALSYAASIDGKSVRGAESAEWSSSYKLGFGQTKLGSRGIRKTLDRFELETTYTLKRNAYVNPYIGATLKTQFARGYQYSGDTRTPISDFIDPAYLTQSAGTGYRPRPHIGTRLGLALREILTRTFTSYSDKKRTAQVENVKIDGGIESISEAEWKLSAKTMLTNRLEVFVPLSAPDEIAIRSDNGAVVKLSRLFTLNLTLQIVKDQTLSENTQFLQSTAFGLSYTFR